MTRRRLVVLTTITAAFGILFSFTWSGRAQSPGGPPALGDALPSLTAAQKQDFERGKTEFMASEDIDEGLGPVFNGTSCGECHEAGALGGAATNLDIARVTRIGRLAANGSFDPLTEFGGSLLQVRSIHEIDNQYNVSGETVPAQADFVSRRQTTPLFGLGLLQAIPEEELQAIAEAQARGKDGVSGHVNQVWNPETGQTEVGRFGWKCQMSSIHLFAGDAYLNEMGITTPSFPKNIMPNNGSLPIDITVSATPEDNGSGTVAFTHFMAYLAPPTPKYVATNAEKHGQHDFEKMGCVSCHVPVLLTGPKVTLQTDMKSDADGHLQPVYESVPALSDQPVACYSDLLVHDMGPGLGDGIPQGTASGSEWRTAPLWGLSARSFFLHDGRAATMENAILAHGGEAQSARDAYARAPRPHKDDLLAFLKTL